MFDEKNLDDITALTSMQEGMLFHYLKDTSSDLYIEQLSLEAAGPLVEDYFEKAWSMVAQANEVMRTFFRWSDVKQPLQIVLKHHHVDIIKYTGRDYPEAEIAEIIRQDRRKGFDLQKVPFRVTLCRINKETYKIIISNHHILYDGWSNGIILKEFFTVYNSLLNGKNFTIPPKTKYKTFVQWKLAQVSKEHKNYWQLYLDGFDTPTELSIKIPLTGEPKKRQPGIYTVPVPREMNDMIAQFSRQYQVTPAALFYCAWGLIVQHYANSDDVIFGSTVSGRNAKIEGIENMVGLFINTLPFRISPGMGKYVPDFLKAIDRTLKERESHEFMSLVDIKACSELDSQAEFFDSLVIIENYPLDASLKETGTGLTTLSYEMQEQTHYDLTLIIKLFDTIEIDMLYDGACLERKAVTDLSGHFITLLDRLMSDWNKRIDELDILTETEKQQILCDFNRTETPYDADKTIHGLFAEQVARTPDYVAVFGHGRLRRTRTNTDNINNVQTLRATSLHITYLQLNEQANHLAQCLLEKGVANDVIVGVRVGRSVELMITLMGVLKAGGAYLPIDPDYPQERIDYMLKDSGAKLLAFANELEGKKVRRWEGELKGCPRRGLAYVIYTSGSTGKPKGVMIEHRAVHNFFTGVTKKIDFPSGQTILALTTVSFDIFVLETLLPLTKGLRIIMANEEQQRDARLLNDLIVRCGADMLQMTPSRLQLLLESDAGLLGLKNIKQIMVGG
ncbi:MAG: condensation domain-containing protein, partial [Acidobacteria bacterium]|nr:condensation domain-containing protein [Acidobacteriota bacterium]